MLKYRSCLLIAMSISRLNFFMYHHILEKLYYHGLRLKCYGLVSTVSCIFCDSVETLDNIHRGGFSLKHNVQVSLYMLDDE